MPEDLRQLKARLRGEAIQRRSESPTEWRAEAGQRIAQRILNLPAIQNAGVVALYASFGHEFATHDLIKRMLAMKRDSGGSVVLPRADPENKRLEFLRVVDFPAGCRRSFAGILEPDAELNNDAVAPAYIDVFVVPGLLFDRTGNRLGYGGGFYDRMFADCPDKFCIAPAFGFQIIESVPRGEFDIPVRAICTEDETIEIA